MKRPALRRIVTAVALCGAFAVMASVIVPLRSGADEGRRAPAAIDDAYAHSVDPHEGLASLGAFEHNLYHIRVYATDGGPRFSIYSSENGTEIAALLSAERITQLFPEIPLQGTDFSAPYQLMHTEPAAAWSATGR